MLAVAGHLFASAETLGANLRARDELMRHLACFSASLRVGNELTTCSGSVCSR